MTVKTEASLLSGTAPHEISVVATLLRYTPYEKALKARPEIHSERLYQIVTHESKNINVPWFVAAADKKEALASFRFLFPDGNIINVKHIAAVIVNKHTARRIGGKAL